MPLAIKNCSAVAQSRGKAALKQGFQIEEALERLKFRAESGCALRCTSVARPAIRSAVDNRTLKDALWIAHRIPTSFPRTCRERKTAQISDATGPYRANFASHRRASASRVQRVRHSAFRVTCPENTSASLGSIGLSVDGMGREACSTSQAGSEIDNEIRS